MASIFQISDTEQLDNYFSQSPTPGEITLMAGKPNEGTSALDANLCSQIKNCGFNAVGATISQALISTSLTQCSNAGLVLFINNGSLYDAIEPTIQGFQNKKGLGGWLLDYSCSYQELISTQGGWSGAEPISNAYKIIAGLDSNGEGDPLNLRHPIFVGFSGDWTHDVNNQAFDFTAYIRNYQEAFKPAMWPVAYFPDLTKTGSKIIPEERITNFYKTLQYMNYVSRFITTPFWLYCRCQGVSNYYSWDGATPQLGLMQGIIFTALAYGAQGIYYWNYRQDASSSSASGTKYAMAPVDPQGKPTETWDIVRQINKTVKDWNRVFCGCEAIECRHVTSRENPQWLKKFKHPVGPLMNAVNDNGSIPELLISHICNDGKDYIVVIRNPFEGAMDSTGGSAINIKLEFSEYWNVYRVSSNNGVLNEKELSNYAGSYSMKPGDFIIFRWD